MRRILIALVCIMLLRVPASGEDVKYAALTFDDGPSGRFTSALLDGLAERGAKATFLLCGYRMKQYPRIAQRIAEEGHEIGNHGYSHKNMQAMSRRDIAAEIMNTEELLPQGVRVRFLRPPGGCCSDGVRQVAEARQLAILSWSVDPRDWATKDATAVTKYVTENTADGDIILLHDMTDSSVQAALDIVDQLTQRGFRFVTVSELARLRGITPRAGRCYTCFPGS